MWSIYAIQSGLRITFPLVHSKWQYKSECDLSPSWFVQTIFFSITVNNTRGKKFLQKFISSRNGCRCRVDFRTFFSTIVPLVGYSLLACFHFCLVSVYFTGPSLLKMNFCRNLPLVSVVFGGLQSNFHIKTILKSPNMLSASIYKLYICNGVLWQTNRPSGRRGKQKEMIFKVLGADTVRCQETCRSI